VRGFDTLEADTLSSTVWGTVDNHQNNVRGRDIFADKDRPIGGLGARLRRRCWPKLARAHRRMHCENLLILAKYCPCEPLWTFTIRN
jgi:hypothetical protein